MSQKQRHPQLDPQNTSHLRGPAPRAPLQRDLDLAAAFEAEVHELRTMAQLISRAEALTQKEIWKQNREADAALVRLRKIRMTLKTFLAAFSLSPSSLFLDIGPVFAACDEQW